MKQSAALGALAAGLCLMLGLASPAFASAEDAIGTWRDTQTGATTQIYSCGGGICVKILIPSKEHARDNYNPNPALKGRSMVGVTIMSGASKAGADRWKGRLYNSEDGDTYTGYITVTGRNEVKLEGCVLGGIICKSRIWRRAQ
ncbi:MAG: DUF2147 domain-containing protein [Rhodomicrobium sp.]